MNSYKINLSVLSLLAILLLLGSCKSKEVIRKKDAPVVSHEIWDGLLKQHVNEKGWVNYEGFVTDSIEFKSYLTLLSENPPAKNWTENDRLAYWINAYNAFTVEIVRRNYPEESIRDIGKGIPFVNTVWDIKFIKIGSKTLDLNNMEHNILRKEFEEPRIHFAINCASYSCPPLRAEAFTGAKVDQQLDEQARVFINDGFRNVITEDKLELSKIFKWFGGDFTKEKSLLEFIRPYSEVEFKETAEVVHLEYKWNLNKQ